MQSALDISIPYKSNQNLPALQYHPDSGEKEGERLVVLHKLSHEQLQLCLAKVSQADMSNLWKLRADQFFQVDEFLYLGTGKPDLRKNRDLAIKLGTG